MIDILNMMVYPLIEFKEKGVIKMVKIKFNNSINVIGQIKTEVEELYCFFTQTKN